jgi:hypothetical protein
VDPNNLEVKPRNGLRRIAWLVLLVVGGPAFFWLAGVTNVEAHVASAYDLPLVGGSVDRAFLVTVLPRRSTTGTLPTLLL